MYYVFEKSQLKLYYKEISNIKGKENFLMLHNAGGAHSFFKYQIPFLQNFGRVIAVDLLGHGKSSKPKREYTIFSYAEDILSFCKSLNLNNVTIIGLNYGANVSIEIANINQSFIKRLILIEPPIFINNTDKQLALERTKYLASTKKEEYVKNLIKESFIKVDPKIKTQVLKAYQNVPQEVLVSIYKNLIEWDSNIEQKIQAIKIPNLYVLTDAMLCPIDKLIKYNNITISKVVGSSYWATLEVPEQINAMISRLILLNN